MAKDVRKHIIVPEYKPLFAMSKCFGPTKGPLEKPCPTPITVIGELLRQKAPNDVTVYEVVKEGAGYSDPVRLTTENYMLPYEDIKAGKKQDTPIKMETINTDRKSVVPERIIPGKPAHVVREVSDSVGVKETVAVNPDPVITEPPASEEPPVAEPAVEVSTPAEDTQHEDTTPAEPEAETEPVSEEQTEAPASEGDAIPDPYAGLTKAERKAMRRAEREAAMNKTAAEQ